ncbi:NAD-binding D-isomer specific 2-hydroxyacid dehydrogenase protein [Salinisphaera shabanensis T35B1]|uniref:D-3-phosphoglycerate dehydrogenase protein n=1 Tax=Salinisphaera shabanensis E1L3A TaxID=1033802 RepID=U2EKA8_9GAMM|nr:phosphoglycerate dehydrogenase [Salinisphaera shabanensis]ERJ18702.1 D-3-phosphoglycerate dehydrogenase protein [Salinisphaera shabanensis E1L3A]
MTFKIQTLNNISAKGLDRLPRDLYEIASEMSKPDAIILRSHNMHDMAIADSVRAIGRAGAGVNNIPVADMSKRGVPVFNAPGANANAVKELVLAGMLLSSRNLMSAWRYVEELTSTGEDLKKEVEAGKKRFKGVELPGRTLGVAGLGAIGVNVANAAQALGMSVQGFDPGITVNNAWRLAANVSQALSIDELLSRSDYVSLHVPLVDDTRGLVDAKRLKLMRKGAVLLNFSRAEIVEEDDVLAALEAGRLSYYVCDFPSEKLRAHDRVITLPHLGASTDEAEDNSAMMIADQLRDFLEVGNIRNSVNFPEAIMPPTASAHRLAVVNHNVPNMVGQISSTLARHEHNIADLLNKSKGEVAYTLVDVDSPVADEAIAELGAIEGVLCVRYLGAVGSDAG